MKHLFLTVSLIFSALSGMKAQDYMTKTGHAQFFSETVAENITANNYKMVSTLDTKTGNMVFSVPIQSFEFEKALMQKHFNQENFMDSKKYPKAKFKGKIDNINDVDFSKSGVYDVTVSGDMTMKGHTKHMTEKGTIEVKGSEIIAKSTFNITIADFGIGKPTKASKRENVADVIKVTVDLNYKAKN
ncbi:MAG: YceI family protein [Bacteroidales bacterium]|nr:YceI family protein [Bacteroidales bacterium]